MASDPLPVNAEWGTVPEWVAAVGTAGAFGGTGWLLIREAGQRRRTIDQEERAQARLVSCWLSVEVDPDLGLDIDGTPLGFVEYVFVKNASAEPVVDVLIYVDEVTQSPPYAYFDMLPPGDTSKREWSPPYTTHEPKPVFEFTDSAGLGWQRDRFGVLTPATEQDSWRPPEDG